MFNSIASDEDVFRLFVKKAPMVENTAEFRRVLDEKTGTNSLRLGFLFFSTGFRLGEVSATTHDWGDQEQSGSSIYTATDKELAGSFDVMWAMAPQFHPFREIQESLAEPVDSGMCLLYYAFGFRLAEHCANHNEWRQWLEEAAEPEAGRIAVPGFDFSLENVMEEVKKHKKPH